MYSGLCIGGPMDGQHLEGLDPTFTVVTPKDRVPFSADDGESLLEDHAFFAEVEIYRYDSFPSSKGGRVGFWRLGCMSTGDVIALLLESYWRLKDLED